MKNHLQINDAFADDIPATWWFIDMLCTLNRFRVYHQLQRQSCYHMLQQDFSQQYVDDLNDTSTRRYLIHYLVDSFKTFQPRLQVKFLLNEFSNLRIKTIVRCF